MSNQEKYLNGITPAAKVAYAWLERPRESRNPSAKPRYTVTLTMDPSDAKVLQFAKAVRDFTQGKKVPITRDEETNFLMVSFHTMKKPSVLDSQNTPLPDDVEVGKGSVARVQYNIAPYESFKGVIGGYTFYFNAVQIIKLVQRAIVVSFPVTQGYAVGDQVATAPKADPFIDDADSSAPADEEPSGDINADNLPF